MQRDAERRVMEMQRRANNITAESRAPAPHIPEPEIVRDNTPRPQQHNQRNAPQHRQNQPSRPPASTPVISLPEIGGLNLNGLLEHLGLDQDKMIIILLILVLVHEHADPKLILALCWILF